MHGTPKLKSTQIALNKSMRFEDHGGANGIFTVKNAPVGKKEFFK